MRVEDLSFADPQKNLDYDDELLRRAERESGGEVLRFWESPVYFVVLGRTGVTEREVELNACAREGIPVLRRSSGGGTVVQGPGCLNFSLILSKTRHPDLATIARSYAHILGVVAAALKDGGITASFRPVCDLVVPDTERKFSGNAQRRGRHFLLHHGTILYAFDLAVISRLLAMPPRMPDYRRQRPHQDFVTNIPFNPADFKRALAERCSEI